MRMTRSLLLGEASCLELSEHGLEPATIGEFESLAVKLVKRLAQGSAMQSAISLAAAFCNRLMR